MCFANISGYQVMDLLDHFPSALTKIKQLHVLVVCASKIVPLVYPVCEGSSCGTSQDQAAPCVSCLCKQNSSVSVSSLGRELFRLIAPHWNPLSTDLLNLHLETSGYRQVAEFVEVRGGKDLMCFANISGYQVMDLLDHFPSALAKIKQLHVLVVCASKIVPLVYPVCEGSSCGTSQDQAAPCVSCLCKQNSSVSVSSLWRELFRLIARYWNPLSTDLLNLHLETSGYRQVAEFVEVRGGKGLDWASSWVDLSWSR